MYFKGLWQKQRHDSKIILITQRESIAAVQWITLLHLMQWIMLSWRDACRRQSVFYSVPWVLPPTGLADLDPWRGTVKRNYITHESMRQHELVDLKHADVYEAGQEERRSSYLFNRKHTRATLYWSIMYITANDIKAYCTSTDKGLLFVSPQNENTHSNTNNPFLWILICLFNIPIISV